MGVQAQSAFTVKLGGVPLSVIPDPTIGADEPSGGSGYSGLYVPQEATRTFVKRDVPAYIKRFSRGAGFVERRDEYDDDGYAWAEDAMMWLGNGALPSGRRQNVGAGYGLLATNAFVLDSAVFNGHLYTICNTGHGIRWPNADPTTAPAFDPPLNSFGSGTESFHPGFKPKAIAAFATAAGTPALYISAFNSSTGETRMYQYTTSGGWTASPVLGFRADKMAVCWWEGKDGVGAERLHIQAADSVVRHCIAGTDPLVAANYITPINVGNQAYPITALLAAPAHLYPIKKNGIHDVNEVRAWNVTPYWEEQSTLSYSSAVVLYDDHIYAARGFGLDRYDLRLGGQQQRIPGECGPGFGWQDGVPLLPGYITDLATHDGWLLAALYNPYNQISSVWRAKDRRVLGIDVPSPLVWHGAEQILTGDILITHLRVTPNASSSFGGQSSYLWMFVATNYNYLGMQQSDLYYAPLPSSSGALSIQAAGGTFAYNPTARIYHTALNWDDRSAQKGVHRIELVSRKTSATRTIEVKSRADGDPATIRDQATWTSQGTATATKATLATSITGQSIALQSILTTPSPYTDAPILHEISPRARVVREAFDSRVLWVVLERDYELAHGAPDIRDPDTTFAAITSLQNQPNAAAFEDEQGRSYSVYVEQGIQYRRAQLDEREWRTVARVEITLVA